MRIATWNIRLGIQQGLAPIAETLRELDADLVALQEVGRRWVMGPPGDTAKEIARLADFEFSSFAPSLAWYPPAQYGHALLSRHKLGLCRVVRLPQKVDERRSYLESRLELPDGDVTVLSTHLSHVADRSAQGDALAARVSALKGERVLLLGDLNETDTSCLWFESILDHMAAAPANAPTFPADAPQHRIDWIMSNFGSWSWADTPNTGPQSDHLPVVAELEF